MLLRKNKDAHPIKKQLEIETAILSAIIKENAPVTFSQLKNLIRIQFNLN